MSIELPEAENAAEERLQEAIGLGQTAMQASPDNVIRASFFRQVVAKARAFHLDGAVFTGELDLGNSSIPSLMLSNCTFETFDISGSEVQSDFRRPKLELRSCRGTALLARDLVVDGDMILSDLDIERELDLSGTRLSGRLACRALRLGGHRASMDGVGTLDCRRIHVEGDALFDHCKILGSLDLTCAEIQGDLIYSGSIVHSVTSEAAMTLDGVRIGGDLRARASDSPGNPSYAEPGPSLRGKVSMVGAEVAGEVNFSGATLDGDGTDALELVNASIGKDLYLNWGFHASGQVRLVGTSVAKRVVCTNGTFENERGYAVHASGLIAREVFLDGAAESVSQGRSGFSAKGGVRLVGARIGGELNCTNGTFEGTTNRPALAADRCTCRALYLNQRFKASGQVLLRGASFNYANLQKGAFRPALEDSDHPGSARSTEPTIDLSDTSIDDRLEAQGVEVHGGFSLRFARIHGDLNVSGATLNGGVDAQGVRIGHGVWTPRYADGELILRFGAATTWTDNDVGRAIACDLRDFRYSSLADECTAADRIRWLERGMHGYYPQPYQMLAAFYRAEGQDEDARKVLIASQNRRHRKREGEQRSWSGRAWGRLLWAVAGYGYRPWLAVFWLVVLTAVGTWAIDSRPTEELTRGTGAPPRQPLLYTLSLLLPFVDLGYKKWVASGGALVVSAVLVIIGWVIATALAAALGGILRRGE